MVKKGYVTVTCPECGLTWDAPKGLAARSLAHHRMTKHPAPGRGPKVSVGPTSSPAPASTSSAPSRMSWKERAAQIAALKEYRNTGITFLTWIVGIISAILISFFMPGPSYVRIGAFLLFLILFIAFLRNGWSGVGGFFSRFGVFLLVVVGVGILIYGAMHEANKSGWIEVAREEGSMALYRAEDSSNFGFLSDLQTGWRGFWTGEGIQEQFAWTSDVEQNVDNIHLGLEIKEFFSTAPGSIYHSRDPIILQATLAGQSLAGNLDVNVNCSLEDYLGKDVSISPSEFELQGISNQNYYDEEYSETIRGETYYHVTCIFPEGLYFPDIFFQRKGTNQLSKTAEIKADYEFITNATWDVFFIGKGLKREFDAQGLPPLWIVADNPRVNAIDGIVRGISTYGPLNIGFYVGTRTFQSPQPFVLGSETPLFFNVDLSKNPEWNGYLNEVQSFLLHVPPPLKFTEDHRFCDFEDTNLRDGFGNKLYVIREGVYEDKVNVDCTDPEVRKEKFGEVASEQECLDRYKDKITLNCQFEIRDSYDDMDFYRYSVFAESKYVFTDREWALVNVRRGDAGADVCEGKTEIQCNVPGCKNVYDNNNTFLECVECSSGLRDCEDYGKQDECELDECHFKNCYWVDYGDPTQSGCLSTD